MKRRCSKGRKRKTDLADIGFSLDFLLQQEPIFSGSPLANTFQNKFIDDVNETEINLFFQEKSDFSLLIPNKISELYEDYVEKRQLLNVFYAKDVGDVLEIGASLERDLGNIDPLDGKVVIRNERFPRLYSYL